MPLGLTVEHDHQFVAFAEPTIIVIVEIPVGEYDSQVGLDAIVL